jgi:hypothetical protein
VDTVETTSRCVALKTIAGSGVRLVAGKMAAAIQVTRRDAAVVIRLPPTLDPPGLALFQQTLEDIVEGPDNPFVVVEITATLPIDLSILDSLVEGASRLDAKHGRLVVNTPTHRWSYPP